MNESNATTNSYDVDSEDTNYLHVIIVKYIAPTLIAFIVLVGFLGNSLVIYVIKTRPKLRTVTNMLLLNLAVADLSFLLICPPFTAYVYATSEWPLSGLPGQLLCKVMHYLLNVTVYVTIYTLVLISGVRYVSVVFHHVAKEIACKRNVLVAIFAIWLVMLASNSYLLVFYSVDTTLEVPMCDCSVRFGRIHFLCFFILAYLLPLIVIAIFSLCILAHMQKPSSSVAAQKKSSQQRKKQVSGILIMVVVVFAIFWLPIHLHLIYSYWIEIPDNKVYVAFSMLWNCLAYLNSCANPIIYNIASKDFRDSFYEVVFCRTHNSNSGGSLRGKSRAEEATRLCAAKPTEVIRNGDNLNECEEHHMTGATTISAEDNETIAVTSL